MAGHPEHIEHLVERSSLGDPDARRARAQVPDATARALLRKVTATQASSVRTMRATRSAITGKFLDRRGKRGG